jgi:hypothetical protein
MTGNGAVVVHAIPTSLDFSFAHRCVRSLNSACLQDASNTLPAA